MDYPQSPTYGTAIFGQAVQSYGRKPVVLCFQPNNGFDKALQSYGREPVVPCFQPTVMVNPHLQSYGREPVVLCFQPNGHGQSASTKLRA
jgi:hypothetical protein